MRVLDLFCGAGGATVGMSLLGMHVTGVDWNPDACRTHVAAGHPTVRADLAMPLPIRGGDFDGVWASPPCTAFSMAGKGAGRELAPRLIAAIEAEDFAPWPDVDPAVWLVLPTLAAVLEARPGWTAWENVPQTKPVMKAVLKVLGRHGYRGTVTTLSAERFGVAQTRKRTFIIANRTRVDTITPTHHPYVQGEPSQPPEVSLLGTVHPWVSMAEGLGWHQPGLVLNTGLDWKPGGTRDDAQTIDPTRPGPTLSASAAAQWQWRLKLDAHREKGTERAAGEPAPSIYFGNAAANAQWSRNDQSGTEVDVDWPSKRPATSIAGRPLVADPGMNANRFNGASKSRNDGVHVSAAEAARLQAFPDGHPWQGSKTSTFRQIGNAVPPPVAAVVAGAAARTPWEQPVADYLADLYATPVPREAPPKAA